MAGHEQPPQRTTSKMTAPIATVLLGLMLILTGLGGGWGRAYGQTAGPTPTTVAEPTALPDVLELIKLSSRAMADPGDSVVFTLQLSNRGRILAEDVVVRDHISYIFDIVNVETTRGTSRIEGQQVIVEVGELEPGDIVTITIESRVRPDAGPAEVINIGFASSSSLSGRVESNVVVLGIAGRVPPAELPKTGQPAGLRWPLLALGSLLAASGLLILAWRRRPLA